MVNYEVLVLRNCYEKYINLFRWLWYYFSVFPYAMPLSSVICS